MCKDIKTSREIFDRGPISSPLMKDKDRVEFTKEFDDNSLYAVIYCLHKYGRLNEKLTYRQMSELTGWGWRTLNQQMNHIVKKSPIGEYIKFENIKSFCKKQWRDRKHWFLDNETILKLNYELVLMLVIQDYYKKNPNNVNQCELFLYKILLKLYGDDEWYWNGRDTRPKYVIDALKPDFVNEKFKLIIEHLGTIFHPNPLEEIAHKTERYRRCGYNSLFILETELKEKNKFTDNTKQHCTNRIKEFVDNAI